MALVGAVVRVVVLAGPAVAGLAVGQTASAEPSASPPGQLLPPAAPATTFPLRPPAVTPTPAPAARSATAGATTGDDAWPALAGGAAAAVGLAAVVLVHRRRWPAVAGGLPTAPDPQASTPPVCPASSPQPSPVGLTAVQRAARGLPHERPAPRRG